MSQFEPISYQLDSEYLDKALLEVTDEEGQVLPDVDSVTSAWAHFFEKEDLQVEVGVTGRLTISTAEKKYHVETEWFWHSVLKKLLELSSQEIHPFTVWFCWFDSDAFVDDVDEMEIFFLVYEDEIIEEIYSVYYPPGDRDKCRAMFLSTAAHDPLTRNQNKYIAARTVALYRKFYTETRTGKLAVLRSDLPAPYYYYEGRESLEIQSALVSISTSNLQIRNLLMGLTVLGLCVVAILIFP